MNKIYWRLFEIQPNIEILSYIEEPAELIKAITKQFRGISPDKSNLIEEIADTQIIIDSLIAVLDIDPEDVGKMKKLKEAGLKSLLDKLEGENV